MAPARELEHLRRVMRLGEAISRASRDQAFVHPKGLASDCESGSHSVSCNEPGRRDSRIGAIGWSVPFPTPAPIQ